LKVPRAGSSPGGVAARLQFWREENGTFFRLIDGPPERILDKI
jgi:hypothetical protein